IGHLRMDTMKFMDLTTSCQSLPQGLALTKNDACHIFQNKTIFYVGDASIRTLFRDLAKMLTNGQELTNIEVAVENGEYEPIQGEKCHFKKGHIDAFDYVDFRSFRSSSIKLYYVHFSSLRAIIINDLIEWFESDTCHPVLDLVIFSSATGDMCLNHLLAPSIDFEDHLFHYSSRLDLTLNHFVKAIRKFSTNCTCIWMSLLPSRWPNITNNEKEKLKKIHNASTSLAVQHDFICFDRFRLWSSHCPLFKTRVLGRFSGKGVRRITETICELSATTWNKTLRVTSIDSTENPDV
ncbi:unnamed protein product, partial [Rotaria magnacalcarata]